MAEPVVAGHRDAVRFGVLGPLQVVDGAGVAWPVPAAKQRIVLAALLLGGGSMVSAAGLAEALWNGSPPANAAAAMRTYVMRLRRVLGTAGARIVGGPAGWAVDLRGPGEFDVSEVERLRRAARDATADGHWAQASSMLAEAVGLWRGEPLADVPSPALTRREAGRLDELRLELIEARIDADLRLGRHGELVAELRGLAAEHPLREHLRVQLMLACYRSGLQAAALQVYRDARGILAEELGVEPGHELQQLHQQILVADPDLRAGTRARVTSGQHGGNGEHGGNGQQRAGQDTAAPRLVPASPTDLLNGQMANAPRQAVPEEGELLASPRLVPRQLPAPARHFAGRAGDLEWLSVRAREAADAGAAVLISAIGGTAGVGKTALAVHWAHQIAADFPDGQLYVNLRGFDPSGRPVSPAEAIRGFLDALGVAPGRIPVGLDAQAGLYRSLLAGQRLLIVLDNAADVDQVRPLLPGSVGCLVIVTSRNQLAGLAAVDGAQLLVLDALPEAEARQMLTLRLGADRATAEPGAVSEITGLCACLPIALAIAAARAASRPRFSLAGLAAELRDARDRLDVLDAGDPAASVRVVFSWSYQQLSPAAARMFRLLGVHPGPDITAEAAASLAMVPVPAARRMLAELTMGHLVTEHVPGRFALHDLLRVYAAEQADATESDSARYQAIGRVLDHYLHTAKAGRHLINQSRESIELTPPRPGVVPEQLASQHQAFAWFDAERQVLASAVALAAEAGFDAHAWQIPWAAAYYLVWRRYWHEAAVIQRTALAAATRLNDLAGQAVARRWFGLLCGQLADYAEATVQLTTCLELHSQLGDQAGQARDHAGLAVVLEKQGRSADALCHGEQALELFRATGDRAGEACALNNAGWYSAQLGRYQRARALCEQAVAMECEVDNVQGEANAWDSLGYAEHHLGNLARAADCYNRAVSLFRDIGDRHGEAETLTRLGDTYHAAGDQDAAHRAWQHALVILDELRHTSAGQVRAKLSDLRHARVAVNSSPARR